MADEVIRLLQPGACVNLGIGLPTMVADRIAPEMNLTIHSENGILGVGPRPTVDQVSPTLINAGKETVTIVKGASFFDSSLSFGMIRGGHIDFCVLGGMEVDVEGNLANWMVPGKKITGMGGAMDLVHGCGKLIVMMKHLDKNCHSKLVRSCTLPLTGMHVVHVVVTDLGIFEPAGHQFKIKKLAPGIALDHLKISSELVQP